MTSKGQITLPKAMRDALGLKAGDEVGFSMKNGKVTMLPKNRDIRELKGIIQWNGPPVTLEDMDNAIAQAVADRYLRSKS